MSDNESLPPPTWVDTPSAFDAMLQRLAGEPALALDTESNSLYAYREQVCLVQVSVPGADFLVDSLVLQDLSGLGPLLADPHVLKVLHGAEYDLTMLQRDFGFVVENLFDTMWASRILGWPHHGLAALLQEHFGVALDKKYQRADWGRRPLPPAQLDYARLDTHYLLPLCALQAEALEAAKRWPQARHRFAGMARTRWEQRSFDPEGFWRVPGARDLDDAGRGVLHALYVYRDEVARVEDCPPFKVLSNESMLTLSQHPPENLEELWKVKGLSRRLVSRLGRELLSAIRHGKSEPIPWERRPPPSGENARPFSGRPTAACQARFEALRAWRNAQAEVRGLEPDIILTNQALWAIAHRNPARRADLARGDLLAGWQIEELGDDLLAVLRQTHT